MNAAKERRLAEQRQREANVHEVADMWKPTIDSYNDPNAYRIAQDITECKELASNRTAGISETVDIYEIYVTGYRTCMRGRGHHVIN